MPLSNCPRCGKTFNRISGAKICLACVDAEEEQFERVYQYLRDNPGVTIGKIAADTEVPERLIVEWFRTKRLLAKDDSVDWPCERCSSLIRTGRLCQKCSGEMHASLQEPPQHSLGGPESAGSSHTGGESPASRRSDIGHQLRSDKYAR